MISLNSQDRRRLLVARQLLGPVGRSSRSIDDVAGALGLLHSTDPSTPHLSIHARTDVPVEDIDAAFYDDRSLVRLTTIRRTVFAMAPSSLADAHGAFNPPLVDRLRRQLASWIDASDEVDEPGVDLLARAERLVLEHLRAVGPSTGNALAAAVSELRIRIDPAPGAAYAKPIRLTSKVLEVLGAAGLIARGRPTGADFTSGAWTWVSSDDWLGSPIDAVGPDIGLAGLLSTYLASFGPATVTDMAWWTGLTKTKVRAALGAIGATEVVLTDGSEPGFVAAGDRFAELDATVDAPIVALLPGLDSTTMGWKQRGWYVDDDVTAGLFDRNGNAGPTVWVDGAVVGAWTQRPTGEIVVEIETTHGAEVADRVDAEARRTEKWLDGVRVNWRYPTPATKRLAG